MEADYHARLAGWIIDRNPMCKHVTGIQVTALRASKLVTQAKSKLQASNYARNRSHGGANRKATHVIRWRC